MLKIRLGSSEHKRSICYCYTVECFVHRGRELKYVVGRIRSKYTNTAEVKYDKYSGAMSYTVQNVSRQCEN